jgi:hypothetical protein
MGGCFVGYHRVGVRSEWEGEICERDDLAFSEWMVDKLFVEVNGESSHFRSQKARARSRARARARAIPIW